MSVPWTFDAATDEPLGPASAQLADQAGIHQHVGDLWAYGGEDGQWRHYSRVIQADSAFAAVARNVYVEALSPARVLTLVGCLRNEPRAPVALCLDASCATCRGGEPCH
jgi:hypothetical protein